MTRGELLRACDANANRASEALRVAEDVARFVWNDSHLSLACKALRHELAHVVETICPGHDRMSCRETQHDVGTVLTTPDEYVREDLDALIASNLQRAQQALRVIEEFAKCGHEDAARTVESLRYRAYTLEKALRITGRARTRLADVRLCVLVDGGNSEQDFRTLVSSIAVSPQVMVQLRDKKLPDGELLSRAQILVEITRDRRSTSIVNDRVDIAMLVGADGVHLGQGDLSILDARRIAGPSSIIGVSTHSLDQARRAVMDGADYLGVGPVFRSTTKDFEELAGLELVRSVAAAVGLPGFAIGGIQPANVAQIRGCGLHRVAVHHSVCQARDPRRAVEELLELLGE